MEFLQLLVRQQDVIGAAWPTLLIVISFAILFIWRLSRFLDEREKRQLATQCAALQAQIATIHERQRLSGLRARYASEAHDRLRGLLRDIRIHGINEMEERDRLGQQAVELRLSVESGSADPKRVDRQINRLNDKQDELTRKIASTARMHQLHENDDPQYLMKKMDEVFDSILDARPGGGFDPLNEGS